MVYVSRDASNAINGVYVWPQYAGQEQLLATDPAVIAFLAAQPKPTPPVTLQVLKDLINAVLLVPQLPAGIKNRLQAFLATLP